MGRDLSPLATSYLERIKTESLPQIERYTVPLYYVSEGYDLGRDRTGVLYCVAGRHFVLTAAHFLKWAVDRNLPLYIDLMDGISLPVPLARAVFHSTEEDLRDVAVIRLPDDIAAKLKNTKEFLFHRQVTLRDSRPDSFYVLFGYPGAMSAPNSKSSVQSDPLIFAGLQHRGEFDPRCDFDPAMHLAISFDQAAIDILTGERSQLPCLRGASGSGIWRIGDFSADGFKNWNPSDVSLVGIANVWLPDYKYIQATWVGYALGLLQDNYPDVVPAMSLIYPRGQ